MSYSEEPNLPNNIPPMEGSAHKPLPEKKAMAPLPPEEEDEVVEAPAIMALYTTLMLLLMTFFIVLCSMGAADEEKFNQGRNSVVANFNVMGLGGSKQALYFVHSIMKIRSATVKSALDMHEPGDVPYFDSPSGDGEGDGIFWEDGLSKEEAQHLHRFVSLGFSVDASEVEQKVLKVKFPQRDVFYEGAAEITTMFKPTLTSFLKLIGDQYGSMEIKVFTHDKPLEETGVTTSLALAALRAEGIAQLIMEIQKVPADRVIPTGYGPYFADFEHPSPLRSNFVELNIANLWGGTVSGEKTLTEVLDDETVQ